MEKTKKIKLFIGLFYIVMAGLFLYLFFSKFSLQEVTSYDFIKNNREYFFELRQANFFILALTFILFTIIWVMFAGFGSPVAIFAGFIFGKWFGLLFLIIGLSIGATGLYIFANYFLKDIIKQKFLSKFQNLEKKFKEAEFTYLLIYRFVGGIPFAISNVLPCMFNVKASNFFLGIISWYVASTFFGLFNRKWIRKNYITEFGNTINFRPYYFSRNIFTNNSFCYFSFSNFIFEKNFLQIIFPIQ